jgi:hypothetical protein
MRRVSSAEHSVPEHAERFGQVLTERSQRLEEAQHKALRDAEIGVKQVLLTLTVLTPLCSHSSARHVSGVDDVTHVHSQHPRLGSS